MGYDLVLNSIPQSVFWDLGNSDPYRALSFDRLHSNNLGMFKDHLWMTAKQMVKAKGRLALGKVESQYVLTILKSSPLLMLPY